MSGTSRVAHACQVNPTGEVVDSGAEADQEYKASLGYIVRLSQNRTTKPNKTERLNGHRVGLAQLGDKRYIYQICLWIFQNCR